MSAPLYNADILRLAATIPHHGRLVAPHGSAEHRSPICGSRIAVDVTVDDDGRVASLGQQVNACALGQAAASLMGAHAVGRSLDELEASRDALAAGLAGTRDDLGAWPGLALLAPARDYPGRHASIRLAFEAVAEATARAVAARQPG